MVIAAAVPSGQTGESASSFEAGGQVLVRALLQSEQRSGIERARVHEAIALVAMEQVDRARAVGAPP